MKLAKSSHFLKVLLQPDILRNIFELMREKVSIVDMNNVLETLIKLYCEFFFLFSWNSPYFWIVHPDMTLKNS